MKVFKSSKHRRHQAFTLIELIVVIAIIGILAGLIFPVVGKVNEMKQNKLAQAELKAVETEIEEYKTKLGFYPPDNPQNPLVNPLYFELAGTTNNGAGKPTPTEWGTIDGSARIGTITSPNINATFNISGFANTSTKAHSDDQSAAFTSFTKNLTPKQVGDYISTQPNTVTLLACSIPWPADRAPLITNNPTLNPWRYNSSHPTNNTGSYDLWVDLVIRGKTNRICNWNAQPVKL
jgi:prepilin-type N-terminal cleavage/methylation domain-containing protein